MRDTDWLTIKTEYITTGLSVRELAQKHGVNYSTLKGRASRQHWTDERRERERLAADRAAQEMTERVAKKLADEGVTKERIIEELADIAFANAASFTQVSGGEVTVTPTQHLSERQARAIAAVEQGKNGVKLKLYDKTKALELLGKHMGMFVDRVVTAAVDPEVIREVETLVLGGDKGDEQD